MRYHDLPGESPPIVFIHGLGCASSCDYPRIASHASLNGRRRLLVDLLGSGFSDRPNEFGYTVEDHASVVMELITAITSEPVDIVGHSMGGTIAVVMASRNPDKVRRLVISEPNLDAGGGTFSTPVARQSEREYVTQGHEAAIRGAITDGHTIWAGSMLVSFSLAVHRGAVSLVRGGSPSWRDQLISLRIPRTVVFGEHSLPDADTERLPRSGVAVRIVQDAGHSMVWENPSAYAKIVSEILA